MVKFVFILLCNLDFWVQPCSQNSIQNTPSKIVQSFISDYKNWNDLAISQNEKEQEKADRMIEEAYQRLIEKYCQAGKKHQPLAYGSVSAHHPEHERIISEKTKGNKAIVKTEQKNQKPPNSVDHYEYHLININNQWFLEEVYYVDEDGKYEGL
jgi:hypothetical protein